MGKNGIRETKKIENVIQNTKTSFVLVCNVTMSMFLAEVVIVITWHKVHGRKGGWRFCAKAGGLCSSSSCTSLPTSLYGAIQLHIMLKV
jgi:hypothetical protein